MKILPNANPEDWSLEHVNELIGNIERLALSLAGGVAIIFILIGAFWYLTAFGNEEKAQKGKTTLMWAIIGLVVIILAQVIISEVKNLLI